MRAMRPHRAAKFRGPPNSTAPVTGAQASNSSARRKRVRKQFDYEAQDESSILNATEKFRAELFFTVMDNAIASFTERFQQLTKFHDNFGFLFDIVSKRGTDALDDSALEAHSLKLEKVVLSQTQSLSLIHI